MANKNLFQSPSAADACTDARNRRARAGLRPFAEQQLDQYAQPVLL